MDSLEEDLEKVELGEVPSPFGEIQFDFELEPVSQGASSKQKAKLRTAIKKVCSKYQFLLSGDVQVEIQWLVHQQYRYEYHKAPDIDNIIKPLLDSLCGNSGLLIDDTQVQYIGSHWIDWTKREHKLTVTIKYAPDDYVFKSDLVLVEVDKKLCLPFNIQDSKEANIIILNHWKTMIDQRNQFDEMGMDYYSSRMILPIQRFFHKNKLNDYPVFTVEELIEKIKTTT